MTADTKSAKIDIEQEAIMFETGKFYTWRDIRAEIGGDGKQWYLPTVNGRVVARCFKRSPTTNPDAPDMILPGNGPFIKEAARQFTAQDSAVPIFIKQAVNQWPYVGMYKVARQSFNEGEINQHAGQGERRPETPADYQTERQIRRADEPGCSAWSKTYPNSPKTLVTT